MANQTKQLQVALSGYDAVAYFYRGAGGDTLPQWNENEAERRTAADKH